MAWPTGRGAKSQLKGSAWRTGILNRSYRVSTGSQGHGTKGNAEYTTPGKQVLSSSGQIPHFTRSISVLVARANRRRSISNVITQKAAVAIAISRRINPPSKISAPSTRSGACWMIAKISASRIVPTTNCDAGGDVSGVKRKLRCFALVAALSVGSSAGDW